MKRVLGYILGASLVLSPAGHAADDDDEEAGGMLVEFLEGSLSGDSRQIKVSGLEGTFSSRATIAELTVADDDGVWLSVQGAVLDWNRLSLLRGRFSVNALTAEKIEVLRAPNPVDAATEAPTPEATAFQLPELPVSIELGDISVPAIVLGESLLGESALLSLTGSLELIDGALDTNLAVHRLDRQGDGLKLQADFSNETRIIDLDLDLTEGPGGLFARATKLPGAPAVVLRAKGNGPVENFTADLKLATNGEDRLAGQVKLKSEPSGTPDVPARLGFNADLGGDVRPLMPDEYQSFFGEDVRLRVDGQRDGDGALTIRGLALRSAALDLTGRLSLSATAKLNEVVLSAHIRPLEGHASVLLPLTGPPTRLAQASVMVRKDATTGDDFEITADVRNFERPEISVKTLEIAAEGVLDQAAGLMVDARVRTSIFGLQMEDQPLSDAIGHRLDASAQVITDGSGALKLRGLDAAGEDYALRGDFSVKGLSTGLEFETDLTLGASDLSRFSGLAGRPLSGGVSAAATVSGAPLSGVYDVQLDALGRDLGAGIEQVDQLLVGSTTLQVKAARGFDGLAIDTFSLTAAGFEASARGTLTSTAGTLTLDALLRDIAPIVPGGSGPLTLSADVTRDGRVLTGDARLDADNETYASVAGSVDLDGRVDARFDAVLAELGRFLPELSGNLTASGSAMRDDGVWTIASEAAAPAGIEATVAGQWDEARGAADLEAKGKLRLDAANLFISPNSIKGGAEFDLTLKGVPSLDALRGTVTTSGTSLAIPGARQSLRDIAAAINIENSSATVQAAAQSKDGGGLRVSGPIGLLPPFQSGLNVTLDGWILTDSLAFTSTLFGELAHRGALTGASTLSGKILFQDTEINLANISGSVSSAPIPPIRHVGETSASHRTRANAGLIETAKSGAGPKINLDILLSAPSKVFARGRGLQAELGGEIHVRGSADKVAPSGQISLIRGTFDFLGRQLELTKGIVTLQGDLTPYLEFASTTNTSEGTASLEITGPLDAPVVEATSDPTRPSEEVLALILFGDNIEDLSPLALAQLAASVARLRGGGLDGEGKIREGTGADAATLRSSGGQAGLGLGGYLTENFYTDFSVNTRGDTELKLNLDVSDSVTLKGTVDQEGETSVGVFFERDY